VSVVQIEGAINFRPVGRGVALARHFYRSGDLTRLRAMSAAAMYTRLGIRSFIDLRSTSEVEHYGEPIELTRQGVAWVRSPIEGYSDEPIRSAVPSPVDYARYYLGLLDTCLPDVVNALTAIADRCDAPVVFGCHAGKDRTGLLAMALLEIAGASRRHIRFDYADSSEALEAAIDEFADKWERRGLDRRTYLRRVRAHPETIDALYELLGSRQLIQMLSQVGFSSDRQARLAKAFGRGRPLAWRTA